MGDEWRNTVRKGEVLGGLVNGMDERKWLEYTVESGRYESRIAREGKITEVEAAR